MVPPLSSLPQRPTRRSLGPTSSSNKDDASRGIPPPTKIPKRANSIAATEFIKRSNGANTTAALEDQRSKERENMTQPLPATSRRNAPGPRKSSIRARPPQVFASPSGMTRSPNAPPPRQSIGAIVKSNSDDNIANAAALVAEMEDDTPSKKRKAESPLKAVKTARQSLALGAAMRGSQTMIVETVKEKKMRRVTFSNRQERTDFIRDEPTMHIRAPIEGDPASVAASTTASTSSTSAGGEGNSISRYGSRLGDDDDDESSSEEEDDDDETSMSMEMATVSGSVAPLSGEADDQTMDLTAPLGSTSSARARGRRSSGAASNGSVDMDLTAATDREDTMGDESDLIDLGAGEESGMDLTMPMQTAIQSKGRRARDSLASHRAFGRPSLSRPPRGRPSASAFNDSATMDLDLDDASRSAMELTEVMGQDTIDPASDEEEEDLSMDMDITNQAGSSMAREAASASYPPRSPRAQAPLPNLPFQLSPTKSPATPSRFRRSLVGAESPMVSPARRIQAPFDPALGLPPALTPSKANGLPPLSYSARKASPNKLFASELAAAGPPVMRKSLGGALPSAHALKPGKTPVALQTLADGAKKRNSIVAAVIPYPQAAAEESSEEYSGEDNMSNEERASMSFQSAHGGPEDDEAFRPPPRNLTLSEFFSLSGMNFHDDTRPVKVRVLPTRETKKLGDGSERTVAQFKAMAGSVPMLETLVNACRELHQSGAESEKVLRDIEERFVSSPPDLVRELLSLSSEAEKKEMESQFKLQKQAARAVAKEGYLGWCLDNQYGEEVVANLHSIKQSLEDDLTRLNADSVRLQQEILPVLRDRRNALREQVNRVRERKVEIEKCPVEDLEGLHAGMAELLPELQSRRSVYLEKQEALERMRAKLEENLTKKAELEEAIEASRKVCEQIQGYTRGEAARLAADIREVEKLHMWKLRSASLSKLHLTHDWTLDLVVLLGADGSADDIELSLTPSAVGNVFHEEFLEALKEDLADREEPWRVPALIRHISTAWTSARRLQSELSHLSLSYPYEVQSLANQQLGGSKRHIKVQTSVLLAKRRTKVLVTLRVDLDALIWGDYQNLFGGGNDLVNVSAIYGQIETEAMAALVGDHLSAEDFMLGSGAIAQACHAAVETFAG